ncbi:MAG: hypothetical protein HY738_04095 [Bacteroidia bacterium]|nr:hypothetical protein [Bacteroidia bacterium]
MTYVYNAYGQLEKQTDARGDIYEMTYDELGRLKTKTCSTETYTYAYDAEAHGKGLLDSITGPNNTLQSYKYDNFGRIKELKEEIDAQNFVTKYEYDNFGNLSKTIYPSDFSIMYAYDDIGNMTSVKRSDNDALVWTLDEINALGQVTRCTLGTNQIATRIYDNLGYPDWFSDVTGITAALHYDFTFDQATGNLTYRKDMKHGQSEDIYYDALQRLDYIKRTGIVVSELEYNNNGNIQSKTGLGAYSYGGAQPNAVTKVDNTDNIVSSLQQDISYNSFNKAFFIQESNYQYYITYGVDNERRKTELYQNNNWEKTKYYSANYEKIITPSGEKQVHYISASSGLIAVYIINNGQGAMYYISTDYLGSILALTDESGAVVEKRSYDAWGRPRSATEWSITSLNPGQNYLIDRGFTGHEHIHEFGLINMNGRIYDPLLGRFLSPDNFVQLPDYTQTFNRYSYALNNPLKYTDPDGECFAALIICTGITMFMYADMMANAYEDQGQDYWSGFAMGAVIGFTSSVVSSGAGAYGSTIASPWLSLAYSTTSGAVIGGASAGFPAKALGGSFWEGAKYGAIGGAASGFAQGILNEAMRQGTVASTPDFSTRETGATPIDYTHANAEYYWDVDNPDVKGVESIKADLSIPEGYDRVGNVVYDPEGQPVIGATQSHGWFSRKSDVWLWPGAFESRTKLFLVNTHEGLHVTMNYKGWGILYSNVNKQEVSARVYTYHQSRQFPYDPTIDYFKLQNYYNSSMLELNMRYYWSNFGMIKTTIP